MFRSVHAIIIMLVMTTLKTYANNRRSSQKALGQ